MTITVHSRVYLRLPGKTLVVELLDGQDESSGHYVDAWRLIDISTGEEFCRNGNLHDVIHEASVMTCEAIDDYNVQSGNFTYIEGRVPAQDYKTFRELPLDARLKWITSHAQDLEHDFKIMGPGLQNGRDPIEVAVQELNEMYSEQPCFYLDRESGKWELDLDRC